MYLFHCLRSYVWIFRLSGKKNKVGNFLGCPVPQVQSWFSWLRFYWTVFRLGNITWISRYWFTCLMDSVLRFTFHMDVWWCYAILLGSPMFEIIFITALVFSGSSEFDVCSLISGWSTDYYPHQQFRILERRGAGCEGFWVQSAGWSGPWEIRIHIRIHLIQDSEWCCQSLQQQLGHWRQVPAAFPGWPCGFYCRWGHCGRSIDFRFPGENVSAQFPKPSPPPPPWY